LVFVKALGERYPETFAVETVSNLECAPNEPNCSFMGGEQQEQPVIWGISPLVYLGNR
jgi:hypothetical protein